MITEFDSFLLEGLHWISLRSSALNGRIVSSQSIGAETVCITECVEDSNIHGFWILVVEVLARRGDLLQPGQLSFG
ncbi:hypothetical protein PMAYCL1PPCAC_20631 [Pristionchus mayeri]|uniref:Uncharacterized protein n=1 Tax=Pristionchus mayeri TaxID=1317129 RepID=A0AAN5CTA4_9BILA|nr:hypothetical protein PMAYCL1PPCAC_20631 [Pristionchus mayeri]